MKTIVVLLKDYGLIMILHFYWSRNYLKIDSNSLYNNIYLVEYIYIYTHAV